MAKILIFDDIDSIINYADKFELTVDWDNSQFVDGDKIFFFALVDEYAWWDTE